MAEDDSTTKKARKSKASSDKAIEKLAEARFLIDEEPANSAEAIAFVHAVLCQIGLPRSPQKDRVWTRANGRVGLCVMAGRLLDKGGWVDQPLPQGPYARLILADIATYSVRYKTQLIPMEDSVSAYMRKRLKLAVSGGAKGTYTSFKREAQALASAHMSMSVPFGEKQIQTNAPPIEEFAAWTVDEGAQQALWPCELWLSERFFKSLQAHAVPIDLRAYRALAHSALAQDIYTWLAHRLPRLKAPLALPWAVLAEQFGDYASAKKFRDDCVKRLKEVRAVYPDAQIELVRGYRDQRGGALLLKPSKPPVYPVASVVPAALGAAAQMEPVSQQQWQPQDARRRIDAGGKRVRERLTRTRTDSKDSPSSLALTAGLEDLDGGASTGPNDLDEVLSDERRGLQERLRHLADDSPERMPILERVRQIDRERLRLRASPQREVTPGDSERVD